MRSNAVPSRASSVMRRAISTASRPSPGAEKNTASPARPGPRGRLREEILAEMGQGRGAACRAGGHACGPGVESSRRVPCFLSAAAREGNSSRRAPSSSSAASVRSSPSGTVTSTSGETETSAPTKARSAGDEIGTSSRTMGIRLIAVSSAAASVASSNSAARSARPRGSHGVLEARQELADVFRGGAAVPELGERPGRDAREPQLTEGRGQRAGEPREPRHRLEVAERARPERLERAARGERRRPERARGRRSESRQLRRGHPRGELGEARALETEGRARRHRHAPHEVVGGLARGADDHGLGRGRQRREEGAGGLDALRGGRGHDGADHGHLPRNRTVRGYTVCAPIKPDRDRPVNDSIV